MNIEPLEIAKGDYGYSVNFTVKDNSNVVYPLTEYTIRLKVWPESSGDVMLDGLCVIDEALDGTCHYAIASGNFDIPGTYYAELELTKTGAKESTRPFTLVVLDSK